MKTFRVLKLSAWTGAGAARKVEDKLNELAEAGYEIVSVSFGMNSGYMPTGYITYRQQFV